MDNIRLHLPGSKTGTRTKQIESWSIAMPIGHDIEIINDDKDQANASNYTLRLNLNTIHVRMHMLVTPLYPINQRPSFLTNLYLVLMYLLIYVVLDLRIWF